MREGQCPKQPVNGHIVTCVLYKLRLFSEPRGWEEVMVGAPGKRGILIEIKKTNSLRLSLCAAAQIFKKEEEEKTNEFHFPQQI